MKKIIISLVLFALMAQGAAGYTYTETDIDIVDWSNLSTAIDADYITSASINYSCTDISGVYLLNGTEYTRKKIITIDNTAGGALSGYQLNVVVSYDADMQTDFDDIRFAYTNNTEIPYYLNSKTDGTTAEYYIKIDVAASSELDINMYYGNSEITTNSEGEDVYDFYQTGEASKWSGTYDYIGADYIQLSAGKQLMSIDTFGYNSILEGEIRRTDGGGSAGSDASMGFASAEYIRTCIDLYYALSSADLRHQSHITTWNEDVLTTWTQNTWYAFDLTYRSGNSQIDVNEGTYTNEHTTQVPTAPLSIQLFTRGDGKTNDAQFKNIRVRQYVADVPGVSFGTEQTAAGIIEILPRAEGGYNGSTIFLSDSVPYNVSTININDLSVLKNIEHIKVQGALNDINASIEINYNTPHAVLMDPLNNTNYYQGNDIILSWYSNPQGTTVNYYVAYDADYYSIIEQGSTSNENASLSALDYGIYYWKVSINNNDSETRVFNKIDQAPPGLFNFTAFNEETFTPITNFNVKLYNSTWFKEKSATDNAVLYNSTEVEAGEYTALINASGYYPRWYVVNSPENVSVYLPSSSSTVRLIDFGLIDYTNKFNYPDTRLIITKTTTEQGNIIVSDRYFDVSGSNPVYLIDYNNYILTLENNEEYQKSIGSYLPTANSEVSLVVGEIATIPDTEAHGGFNYNITKENNAIILKWNAPAGCLNSAFQYNITANNNTVYEINTAAPYGTATYYRTSNDTHLIWMYADTTGGVIDHQEHYRPQQQLIDMNVSDFWYNVVGIFGLIIMGLLFSFKSAKTGAILTALAAVFLSVIGLLHISSIIIALAVVVAFMGKLSEDKQT